MAPAPVFQPSAPVPVPPLMGPSGGGFGGALGGLGGLLGGLVGGPFGAIGMSLLPGLLGGLFGGESPQEKLMKQIQKISNPANLNTQTTDFYRNFLNSPAYAQSQANIAGGSNQALNVLRQGLGARGLGSSGIGAVAPAITSSLAGNQLGQLQSSTYGQAQNAAQQSIQQQIQALVGGANAGLAGPGQNQQLFGGGLQDLAKYFAAYLSKQNPQMATNPQVKV